MSNYEVIDAGNGKFIKAWKKGVKFEDKAIEQLKATARLPFIYKWVAAMPDTHFGMGATVGSVVPTKGAICPAAVGVDIGCGMAALKTDLKREELGDLHALRLAIEAAVPAGRTNNGGVGDRGAWGTVPDFIQGLWDVHFKEEYDRLCEKHPKMRAYNTVAHLGTLGTGNHFIELAEDEHGTIWIVLHSGSRGLGNKIGQYFTDLAKKLCKQWFVTLPDPDLAYLPTDTPEFKDYKQAVELAQRFAMMNRTIMLGNVTQAIHKHIGGRMFEVSTEINSHHNYIAWENHFGENVMVTRKGAVRAREGDMGIIPGSMGARTYIVRGLGSTDSFCTCSHGAGRSMSRTEATKRFTVADHVAATEGVECNKTLEVIDETPAAYKPIDDVMKAQSDLVEPVYILKQFLNVKGIS
jgi:tRNA-splicing ligase RtcB (3'-phosphate/5'-hydroxy nucleic acid ligase)